MQRTLTAALLALTLALATPALAAYDVADTFTSTTARYTATTNQVAFNVPWPYDTTAAIKVYVSTDSGATWTLKTLTTHYTLTAAGTTSGGTLTFVTAPGNGALVQLARETPIASGTALGNTYVASAVNRKLNIQDLQLQEVEQKVDERALLLPVTESAAAVSNDVPTIEGQAGQCLTVNALETGVDWQDPDCDQTCATDAYLDVKEDCGATGDGVADDTTEIQACLDSAEALDKVVMVPAGSYLISSTLEVDGVSFVGLGKPTILKNTLTGPILEVNGRVRVENFYLRFTTRPTVSNTLAFGIQFGDRATDGTGPLHSNFQNLEILQTFAGIVAGPIDGIESDSGVYGAGFSNSFDNIVIRDFYYSAINHNLVTGADTGDHWSNIYINAKAWNAETRVVPAGPVIFLEQQDQTVFTQLNIEWVGDDAGSAYAKPLIELSGGATESLVTVINSLHTEGIVYKASADSFIKGGLNSTTVVNGWVINASVIEPASGFANLFLCNGNSARLEVHGMSMKGNEWTATKFRPAANASSHTSCSVGVTGYNEGTGDAGIITVDTTQTSSGYPIVRRWNDADYFTNFGGLGQIVATESSKTISSGLVTLAADATAVVVDTEGAASTDDLDGFSDSPTPTNGAILVLSSANTSRDVTVLTGLSPTGGKGFTLAGGRNALLGHIASRLVVQYDSSAGKWVEIARSQVSGDARVYAEGDGSTLTVASGVVTPLSSRHLLDTEASAATDDLDTITAPASNYQNWLLYLSSANSGRDTTLKDGTGNLSLAGDFALSDTSDMILLMWNATLSRWVEVSRSDNG